jgi:hypothetical protein
MEEKKKKTTKSKTTKPKSTTKQIKVTEADKTTFPHSMFPVKLIHKDGKNLEETKICYFQSESYAKKYIERSRFKKTDYQMYIKPEK